MRAQWQAIWLRCQIFSWRWGWAWWLVLALAVQALLLGAWLLPSAAEQKLSLQAELKGLRQRAAQPQKNAGAELEAVIAEAREPLAWWSRAQLLAQGRALKLPAVEFTHQAEPLPVARLNASVPLSGSYLGVRGLITDLLLDAPTLALESLEIRAGASGEVKANLALSYWHALPPGTAASGATR